MPRRPFSPIICGSPRSAPPFSPASCARGSRRKPFGHSASGTRRATGLALEDLGRAWVPPPSSTRPVSRHVLGAGESTRSFRSRVMFPIRDRDRRLLGFAGMATNPGPSWPRWLTPPDGGRSTGGRRSCDRPRLRGDRGGRARCGFHRLPRGASFCIRRGRCEAVAVIGSPITPAHVAPIAAALGVSPAAVRLERPEGHASVVVRPSRSREHPHGQPPGTEIGIAGRVRTSDSHLRPDPIKTKSPAARAFLQIARAVLGIGIPLAMAGGHPARSELHWRGRSCIRRLPRGSRRDLRGPHDPRRDWCVADPGSLARAQDARAVGDGADRVAATCLDLPHARGHPDRSCHRQHPGVHGLVPDHGRLYGLIRRLRSLPRCEASTSKGAVVASANPAHYGSALASLDRALLTPVDSLEGANSGKESRPACHRDGPPVVPVGVDPRRVRRYSAGDVGGEHRAAGCPNAHRRFDRSDSAHLGSTTPGPVSGGRPCGWLCLLAAAAKLAHTPSGDRAKRASRRRSLESTGVRPPPASS